MSRSSELRKAKYVQQKLSAGDFDEIETTKFKNALELDANSETHNLPSVVLQSMRTSKYARELSKHVKTFEQLVDETYESMRHAEPFVFGGGVSEVSSGYCLLYRAFKMGLTRKQIDKLCSHKDSPFIRCLGFLYVRYGLSIRKWVYHEFFAPYIMDSEKFKPSADPKRSETTTIGRWIRDVLLSRNDVGYYRTALPRIPTLDGRYVEDEIIDCESAARRGIMDRVREGDVLRARFSEDGVWYDARVDRTSRSGAYVTYLPEEEYGNKEFVQCHRLKMKTERRERSRSRSTSDDDDERRSKRRRRSRDRSRDRRR